MKGCPFVCLYGGLGRTCQLSASRPLIPGLIPTLTLTLSLTLAGILGLVEHAVAVAVRLVRGRAGVGGWGCGSATLPTHLPIYVPTYVLTIPPIYLPTCLRDVFA